MITLPDRKPRKRTETDVVKACIVAIGRIPGVRAARNNVGVLPDRRGIPVAFGLAVGSPDIMGVITFGGVNTCVPYDGDPDVGLALLRTLAPVAVAFGLEVKKPAAEGGRNATRDQRAWKMTAARRGLLTSPPDADLARFVVRTPEEAVACVLAIRNAMRWRIRAVAGALA